MQRQLKKTPLIFASQLWIQIEMAFGVMVKKWGILEPPLTIEVHHIGRLMVAIA
jgi:hypothetical protein